MDLEIILNVSPKRLLGYGAISLMLGAGLVTVTQAFADGDRATQTIVPGNIIWPYEGFLKHKGQPLTGTRKIKFALYASDVATTPLWTEEQTVNLYNGRFAVSLGATNSLTSQTRDAEKLYLGLTIVDVNAQGTETDVPLAGRQRFEPVPHAAWTHFAADFHVESSAQVARRVGIGTANPTAGVDIRSGGNGNPYLRAGKFEVDSDDSQGLVNLTAGARIKSNSSGHQYNSSRGASRILLDQASISLQTSNTSSGTAGNTITWVEAFTIANSGAATAFFDADISGLTTSASVNSTSATISSGGLTVTAGGADFNSTLRANDGITMGANTNITQIDEIKGYDDLRLYGDNSYSSEDLMIEADGDVIINNNLTVNGDITNLSVSSEYTQLGDGSSSLGSTSDRFCFLTQVNFDDNGGGHQTLACQIYASNGTWYLQNVANGGQVDCRARCFAW